MLFRLCSDNIHPFDIIEYEIFAEEIVWMLVSSIGLVLAAPLATMLAALWFSHQPDNEDRPHSH